MLTPKNKRAVYRIIPFGLIWMTYAFIYLLLEKGLLYDLNFYPSTGNPYKFGVNTVITLLVALFSGLLVGVFEIKVLNNLFVRFSFGQKLVYKTIIYIILMIIFVVLVSAIGYSVKIGISPFDEQIWSSTLAFLSSFTFWSFQLYLAAVIGVSLFYSEVSDNIGLSVLNNFLRGKYHKPVQEERIFMFLDMKSSTSIAEKIGDLKYFSMLKEFYADLTDAIIQYEGEIYQYIGDEIVVSWKLKSGLQNNNCLHCFFAMKDAMSERSEHYQSKFGVSPTFKAGFHLGQVTTGEIGVIKKEIVFSGDVLNSTARIQGLCNSYNVEILISDQLKNKLNFNAEFQYESHGINELRGRAQEMELFSILLV